MKLIFTERAGSVEELRKTALRLKQVLLPRAVVLLSGELGAGKTTLVSLFCELHGLKHMQSPTFSVHNTYSDSRTIVDHYDLYRLETEEQLEASGFFDLINQRRFDYAFIEWPERLKENDLAGVLNVYQLCILIEKDDMRCLTLTQIN